MSKALQTLAGGINVTTALAVEHHYTQVNGIRMHYVQAGDGPLMLCLHGFPEFWYSWRHQIAAFRAAYTVVAPDLRGYNETAKPATGYDVLTLLEDVRQLLTSLTDQPAVVLAHDWGGALAWLLASQYPELVERLVVMNIPHPAVFENAVRRNPAQALRSWYMGLFQLPGIPELLFTANDYALVETVFRGAAIRKEAFSDEDIAAYQAALSVPGTLTAALNWYRALPQANSLLRDRDLTVRVPTLLVWGTADVALGSELTHGTEQYVPDLTIHYIANCSHWVQQEQPALVNTAVATFLQQAQPTAPAR